MKNILKALLIGSILAGVPSLPWLSAPAHAAKTLKAATLDISTKGDELAFDKTHLSVKVGQSVKVTFHNKASKNSGLQHNWVLVKPGTAEAVSQASLTAGADKGWLTESPDIIAHTKLVNAGESATVEFTAPSQSGDYPYFCSFPGHFQVMRGTLSVK